VNGENWVLLALIAAWLLVTLTRLALAHRRAVKAADRKADWQAHLKEGARKP
jgi:hypothetical protein